MPEDVGGSPYPDGADHGGADDAFAAVVFDEAFIRAATVHEPSAHERILAAVEARLELDAPRIGRTYRGVDSPGDPDGEGLPEELRPYLDDEDDVDWGGLGIRRGRRSGVGRRRSRTRGSYGRHAAVCVRWRRPVAWFLAVVMGLGVVAVTAAAVYRGATGADAPTPYRSSSENVTTPGVEQPKQAMVTNPGRAFGG